MQRTLGVSLSAFLMAACGGSSPPPDGPPPSEETPKPPATAQAPEKRPHFGPELARRDEVVDTIHGEKVADPYRWLEQEDSSEVQAWMKMHQQFTRKHLDALPGRQPLEQRLTELFYLDWVGAPRRRGTRYFFSQRRKEDEKAIYYVRQGKTGDPKVLLDPHKLSDDGSIAVKGTFPSWNGAKLAYKLSENNADTSTLYVMDVTSGKKSEIDTIAGARYANPSWEPNNRGFYYVRLPTQGDIPETEMPGYAEVRYHRLGTDPKDDPLIFEKSGDPKTFTGVGLSRDGRHLFVGRYHGWTKNDVFWKDLTKPGDDFKPLVIGQNAKFWVQSWGGWVYVHTNYQAPKWRVLRFRPHKPEMTDWQEIVPERQDAKLEDMNIVGGHLSLNYLKNATSELEIRRLDGKSVRTVELPAIGSAQGLIGLEEDDEAYYSFTSFTYPTTIFKTSVRRGGSKPYFELDAPVDASPYQVKQVWYDSKDGTKVSMFLIHAKNLKRDGSTPFYLTGYGGFNVSRTPGFRGSYFTWLDAGGGVAIPNLRGGGEYGEDWHKAGMLTKKQNVFDDFISAAEYLQKNGYTSASKLAIAGGSNGGLLVGAAMTQRPELFGAVACFVPLLDMVRYHQFGAGKTWISEYGSSENADQFKALHAYSPYHRVVNGTKYPALLMLSADSDDRVDPMHARKFVAAIQHAAADPKTPVLLRIEENAGHGGSDLVKKDVELYTDVFAFLFERFGMKSAGPQGTKGEDKTEAK